MAGKNTAVFGIYPNRTAAEEAVGHLRSAGFRSTDASVLVPENLGTKDLAHEKNTKAPEGATSGAIIGVIVGGVLGYLISAGILAIPVLAPYTTAGPVVSVLAGAGLLGIIFGIIGALIGLSFPEYEARRFVGRIRDGGVLLSVHCDNREWSKRAKEVLAETGAQDIGAAGEKSGDFANRDKPGPRVRNVTDPTAGTVDPTYTGRPMASPPPANPDTTKMTGDEVYTERVIRRRTIQDPDK